MAKTRSKPKKTDPESAVDSNRQKVGKGLEVGIRQTAAVPTVPQSHGGALSIGGTPGNKGGPGRTPDQLRGTIRQIIDEHGLPFLKAALSATGTVTCPHCQGEVEVPADPKLMAKLLDTGLRASVGTHVEIEHQGVVVVVDGESLSV